MLTVNQVTLNSYDKTLLKNVSLTVEKGRLYGLIGHNGSGKSTLIKLLAGEMSPSEGLVQCGGETVAKMPPKTLAKHIGYLPQKLPEASAFMVEELVMLGRYPWQGWLQKPSDEDKNIVKNAMALTKVERFADQPVSTLSGGERARAWLSMCLAQQTEYLLLDEPLAALDIVYQVEVLKLIQKLVKEQNLGVVIIIHDINLAAQYCDEFIALKQGEVCHQGDVSSSMQPEILHHIFGIHLHLLTHPTDGYKVAVV